MYNCVNLSVDHSYIKSSRREIRPSSKIATKMHAPCIVGDTIGLYWLIAVHYEYLHWWRYTAEPKRDWKGLAISIHTRCWNLAQCILGRIVERHLDIFTALMLRKIREWKPGYEETWEEIDGSSGM